MFKTHAFEMCLTFRETLSIISLFVIFKDKDAKKESSDAHLLILQHILSRCNASGMRSVTVPESWRQSFEKLVAIALINTMQFVQNQFPQHQT